MKKVFIIGVILLAAILRFWSLSSIPPSLSHDEVAIGYNAYSILMTGKDEYGVPLPLLFRSFDDYKLPGYIYSVVLSEKVFGIGELAVRFPSAFFGVLTVIVFYLLVQELYKKNIDSPVPLVAAAFLAISPWHINFSRAGFEANGSLFFIVLGAYFLFLGLRKPWFFLLSAFFFVVSLYFYYTARVLIPCLLIVFTLLYYKQLAESFKVLLVASIFGILLLAPIIPAMLTTGLSRINQVSIFEDKSVTNPYSQAILRNGNDSVSKLVYNRRIAYIQQFSDNYLKNFAPDFYFTNGTGPMGLLYLWELPFFLAGIFILLKMPEKWKWINIAWFFSVPLVGGLTLNQPNALRTLANVPAVVFFTAVGVIGAFEYFQKMKWVRYGLVGLSIIVVFFFIRFVYLYFDYYPRLSSLMWGDGHKQAVEYVRDVSHNYDSIYFTGEYWRPYIYYLFYSHYSPQKYQESGTREKIGNVYFGTADWDHSKNLDFSSEELDKLVSGKTLLVLSPKDYKTQKSKTQSNYSLIIIKEINGVFISPAFYAVEVQASQPIVK